MLTVTLVATFAASALWQQWRNVEIESAERQRLQAHWILVGAIDWARLILHENARDSAVFYLSQSWAVPLQEARLSTFLAAADSDNASADVPDIFLSGQITDQQAYLNVANLAQNGVVDLPTRTAFARLFQLLLIDPSELNLLVTQLQLAQQGAANGAANTGPLVPMEFDQLSWLGVRPATLERLRPFVTLLPKATPVNLNTAPAEVIYAVVTKLDWAGAQRLVQLRNQKHFESLADVTARANGANLALNDAQHAITTRYFQVEGQLRSGSATTRETSLLQLDNQNLLILSRRATALAPPSARPPPPPDGTGGAPT